MLENSSSILEILAALYITLAFDEVLYHFVQRFNVRKKLRNTILNNLRDSDILGRETEKFVDELFRNFFNSFSRFAPIFLFLTVIILYITTCDNLMNSYKGFAYVVSSELLVAVLVLFVIFLFKLNWFSHKMVLSIIALMAVMTLLISFFPNWFYFESEFGLDYSNDTICYVCTLFTLLALCVPIIYLIWFSWYYPKLCKKLIENKRKYEEFLNNNFIQLMASDYNYEYGVENDNLTKLSSNDLLIAKNVKL